MARKKKTADTDYPERPYEEAQMSEEEITEAEDRPETDQIEDYHQTHPTYGSGGKAATKSSEKDPAQG